jgi:uncharacterized protein (DUF427 family)
MPSEVLERAGKPDHPITVETAPGPVALKVGPTVVAETGNALILREGRYPPVYYFPKDAVPDGALVRAEKVTHCPYKGDAAHWAMTLPDGRGVDLAAWSYETPIDGMRSIQGRLGFYTEALGAAFDPPAS